MTSAVPKVLVPLTIESAMLDSSTVAEPNTGEAEWVSAASYVAAAIVIRATIHRKYMALLDHTGITIAPEDDPIRWKDIGATDAWAMFDMERTTQTLDTTALTVVMQPGFFNGVALMLPLGGTATVSVKDEPAGTVIFNQTQALDGPYLDEYDWCWGPPRGKQAVIFSGITPYPEAELTVTVAASTGTEVGIGMCAIGDMRPLILGDWGGTEYGASAEPVSKSYLKEDERGYVTIKRRPGGTDLRLSIVLPSASADYALATLQEVQDIPAVVIGAEGDGYAGLIGYGLVTGSVKYEGPNHATIESSMKGLI